MGLHSASYYSEYIHTYLNSNGAALIFPAPLTLFDLVCIKRGMKDTDTSGPGRPRFGKEPLKRIQLMVPEEMHDDAQMLAQQQGVSVSQIYRDWADAARKPKSKKG
ncbi:MAG: hypothetical protein HOO99_03230 [Hyphomicrobiaceae bacterium]|nr:hypothetical protein [Hyphomicrobiaceae bacterium]